MTSIGRSFYQEKLRSQAPTTKSLHRVKSIRRGGQKFRTMSIGYRTKRAIFDLYAKTVTRFDHHTDAAVQLLEAQRTLIDRSNDTLTVYDKNIKGLCRHSSPKLRVGEHQGDSHCRRYSKTNAAPEKLLFHFSYRAC